jgi:hypothetical protein
VLRFPDDGSGAPDASGTPTILSYQMTQDFITGVAGLAEVHTELENQAGPDECGVASVAATSATMDFASIEERCQDGQISCTGAVCGTSGTPPEDSPEIYDNVCSALPLNPFVFTSDLSAFTMAPVEIVNQSDRVVTLSFVGTQTGTILDDATPECSCP